MAPMPPLSGLSAGDNGAHHRGGSAPASPTAAGPGAVPATSGSSLLLRGVLTSSAAGRYFSWKPNNAPTDETDGSGEQGEEEEIRHKTQRSISECYFAVKGTALVLPHDESMHVYRCSNNNVVAGDIRAHLQSMLYMLRREDTLKMAVKLESAHPAGRTRYLVVVSRTNAVGAEEACLLGIDCNHQTTIGLVIPVWADARITLDGDGGFSVTSSHGHYIFKPVSVQAMWSALQSLHKACAKAREFNYFQGGGTHQWVQYYAERIESDQSCLNEWHAMDDLVSKRPPTPDSDRSRPTQKEETEALIRSKLKELMMSVDLDEVTSKFMRSRLEEELDMSLQQFKPFIDQEMLTILGQMDAATEILEYLYLGSEWNASNLEELKDKGVGHILNVTREIDNFYPGFFDYFNIRVYDDETTEMLKHWDKTYKYIAQAKEQGSKVLVHCKMGISRSASVVIAYVMKAYGWDLRQALDFVKTRRSCIKPNSGFMKQLETYQGILHASKQRHNSIWRSKSETNLKDEQPDRSGGRRECRATTSQTLNMGSAAGGCGSVTDGAGPLRASGNSSRGSSLLVPGSVSRPKSWSPDDLASDAFFAANNSNNNNSDGMPSPMHAAIAPGRSKASRRRTGRPRYGTDPLCYTIPPMNAMNAASTTLQQVHATEQEKNAKNTAANGVKANLTVAAPVVPPKCPPAVVTIADEDPGLRRVASVKDRICELESQVGAPKPGGAKPVIKAEVLRSSTTEAVPATARLSKLPLVFLGGPTKTGAAEESPVNVYSCLPSCGGGELSSLELLRDVQPVASQTKPLTPKHTAVIVKSSPPAWTLGGGDSDRELELPMAAPVVEAVPPTTPKEATFSSVLRRSVEDRLPTSPGGVALQRSATDVGLLVAPTSQVACRPAGRHHTLPLHCDAEDTTTTCTARPLAEICKLQVGFGQDSRSESSTATSEARKDATTVVTPQSPLVAELQVDGKKTERFEEHTSMPVDRTGSLLTRCKLRKAKPCLEEKSFARALCLEGGSFPAQTRSMPSTPPEQLPDAPSSPSRQILRSQSLRCEHRPRSLALPATTVPPCMSGRSPPKILDTHAGEAQPLPAFAPGPEIRHSMSTPSVMEAVNEVLCETRQVISNAMHFIPCHSPEAYLPTRGSSQGQERIDPEVTPMPEASEVPQAGIVRQQRAVLEGLQPLRGGTTSMTPANADRKPPVGDSLGRSKKEQTRIIKELGSTMLPPSASPPTGDSPPLGTADQHPEDDESAVGVVKRLTKELEAKARNGKTKPPGIAERLVIVERSAIDGSHESPNCGGSSSTPNSPVCERHCCGQSLRGVRAFSEGRPDLPLVPTTTPAPPTPSRCASFDADRLRRLSATRSITALLARAPRVGEPPPPQLPSLVTGTPTVALIATMPAPAPVGTNPTLPGGLQRKVRKQQGKTHPLSKLTVRQRHANPLYNTM